MHPAFGNDLPVTKATVLEAIGALDLELAFSRASDGIVATLESTRPAFNEFVAGSPRELFGETGYVDLPEPCMGPEDFSYVPQRTTGAFAFLGAAPDGADPATAPRCHSNHMDIDEAAMASGITMRAAMACRFRDARG